MSQIQFQCLPSTAPETQQTTLKLLNWLYQGIAKCKADMKSRQKIMKGMETEICKVLNTLPNDIVKDTVCSRIFNFWLQDIVCDSDELNQTLYAELFFGFLKTSTFSGPFFTDLFQSSPFLQTSFLPMGIQKVNIMKFMKYFFQHFKGFCQIGGYFDEANPNEVGIIKEKIFTVVSWLIVEANALNKWASERKLKQGVIEPELTELSDLILNANGVWNALLHLTTGGVGITRQFFQFFLENYFQHLQTSEAFDKMGDLVKFFAQCQKLKTMMAPRPMGM